jgi:hypothetical protein
MRSVLFLLAAALVCAPLATGQVVINEIRIDQPGTDNDEFFELAGPPAMDLTGLTYLVIGDGTGASGVLETVVDLTGQSIPASGFFVAAEATFTLGAANFVPAGANPLNFENSDNVTHLLVSGFTGASGMDLDTNDDGVLDVTPWTAILDLIAVIIQDNPPTTTEFHYGPPVVGPDIVPGNPCGPTCAPGNAVRNPDGTATLTSWNIGRFDPILAGDTPGAANVNGQVSVATGDRQTLVVDAGAGSAGDVYVLATNFSGTVPGIPIGSVVVPLNFDSLLSLSLTLANGPIFTSTVGALSASGRAFAALNVPVLDPSAVGLQFNSAGVVLDAMLGATLATNPVPLDVSP